MNCSLNPAIAFISAATAALVGAIALALLVFNIPGLIGAIALVSSVAFYLIPQIKAALQAYASCRGPSENCTIALAINTLGQAAAVISIVAFVAALALQITALAFIASLILSWLGVTLAAAAEVLQLGGCAMCGIVILILAGVLTNAYGYKSCMDSQASSSGPAI